MDIEYELSNGESLNFYANEDEMEDAIRDLIKKVDMKQLINWIEDHYNDTVMEMFEVEMFDELKEYFRPKAFENMNMSETDGYMTDYERNPNMR